VSPQAAGAVKARLRWPPTINHYWKARGWRRFISREARAWLEEAIWVLREARGRSVTIRGEVEVVVRVFPPDRRRRDLDNILKASLDALVKAG